MKSKSIIGLGILVGFLAGFFFSSAGKSELAAQADKGKPEWLRAHELRVRKAGEREFTAGTKTWGIEIFKDAENGNLIYISEAGSIAVVPSK